MKALLGALALFLAISAHAAVVHVSWTNPTQYTDGTTLVPADITQTRVEYGTCNGTAFGTNIGNQIAQGNVTSTDLNLSPGTYCIRAWTTAKGVESTQASNVATKTLTQPPPKPPVIVTVDEVAYEIKPNGLVKVAGSVAMGTECRSTTQTVNGTTYTELIPASVTYKPGNRPVPVWGKCATQS